VFPHEHQELSGSDRLLNNNEGPFRWLSGINQQQFKANMNKEEALRPASKTLYR
jgi:hypothetical protein